MRVLKAAVAFEGVLIIESPRRTLLTKKGSVPEILIDRETRFIVRSPGDAVDNVERVHIIRRANCMRRAECFDVDGVVDGYIRVYETIMEREGKHSAI